MSKDNTNTWEEVRDGTSNNGAYQIGSVIFEYDTWKKMRDGSTEDRKLFDQIGAVIDEWDPDNLWQTGCPPDEYECEIGDIAYLFKFTKDINEFAEGIYQIIIQYFSHLSSKISLPECTRIAKEIFNKIALEGLGN